MSTSAPITEEALEGAVLAMYTDVAWQPDKEYHFWSGRPAAEMFGYRAEWLERAPRAAVDSFAGVGNPHLHPERLRERRIPEGADRGRAGGRRHRRPRDLERSDQPLVPEEEGDGGGAPRAAAGRPATEFVRLLEAVGFVDVVMHPTERFSFRKATTQQEAVKYGVRSATFTARRA